MGRIWIKCPATGRYASTRIITDSANLAKSPDQLKNIRGPACGMRHQWLRDDAWLTEANDSAEWFRKAG
jgi:hypothetical protein